MKSIVMIDVIDCIHSKSNGRDSNLAEATGGKHAFLFTEGKQLPTLATKAAHNRAD